MPITVNTTDTFEQWRVKTNQIGVLVESSNSAAANITGGILNNVTIGLSVANAATFTSLTANTLTVANVAVFTRANIGAANIVGGILNNVTIGTVTPNTGAFTSLTASANVAVDTNVLFVDTVANRVGILTTAPGAELDVKGNIRLSGSTSGYVGLAPQPAAGSTTYRLPSADGAANTYLQTAGNGLLSGASVSDDTTTNASYYPLWTTVTTGSPTTIYITTTKLYFNPSTGTLNATVFNALSDASKKTNIVSITDSSDIISKINGVEFNWIDGGKKSAGVIAQELEQILPHLVDTSEDGIKSVNYAGIIAYLIEAVKDLGIKVKNLENR